MAPQLVSIVGCLHTDCIMMVDRIPAQGESLRSRQYREALGGKGANSAIATYRASHLKPAEGVVSPEDRVDKSNDNEIEVLMIGAVGDDEQGRKFTEELQANGVDVSGIRAVEDTRTGVSFVLVEARTGENRCTFANCANDNLAVDDFSDGESLGNGRTPDLVIAQMEIDRAVVEQIIRTAGNAGVDFLLNAAPANIILMPLYQHVTHLLVNENEAAIMYGGPVTEDSWQDITSHFLALGVKNVVITVGALGAYFAGENDSGHVPASNVNVVDCTGAG
jgi:ribokinase